MTITAAPDPASPAAAVVISGTVAGPERAGALVTVWRMLPREARFHVALSAITDARGRYAVILPPAAVMTNAQWYASAGGVRSEPASQSVTALISLRPSTTLVAPGDRVVLSGHVTPWHGGNRILIEQLRRNRWQRDRDPSAERRIELRLQRAGSRLGRFGSVRCCRPTPATRRPTRRP